MAEPQSVVTALDVLAITGPLAGIIITAMIKFIPQRNGRAGTGNGLSFQSAIDRFVSKDNCKTMQSTMNEKFEALGSGQDRLERGQEKLEKKFDQVSTEIFNKLDRMKLGK